MWIFGYGSLVWKVDFPYTQKLVGFIKGYDRRFWQASIDHRGTPEKPGRVVTLVPSSNPEAKVWGICYKVEDEAALSKLNHREKRFSHVNLAFFPDDKQFPSFPALTYIGHEEGPLFLGEADIDKIALQIKEAQGPSGSNQEYVFKLAEFMRTELPPEHAHDEHLFEIERKLLSMEHS